MTKLEILCAGLYIKTPYGLGKQIPHGVSETNFILFELPKLLTAFVKSNSSDKSLLYSPVADDVIFFGKIISNRYLQGLLNDEFDEDVFIEKVVGDIFQFFKENSKSFDKNKFIQLSKSIETIDQIGDKMKQNFVVLVHYCSTCVVYYCFKSDEFHDVLKNPNFKVGVHETNLNQYLDEGKWILNIGEFSLDELQLQKELNVIIYDNDKKYYMDNLHYKDSVLKDVYEKAKNIQH